MSGAGLIELLAARLGGRGVRRASPSLREALVDLSARSAEPGVAGQEEALRQAYGRLSMEMPTENLRLPTSRVSLDDLPDVGPGWRDKDKVAHYADLLAQSEPPPIMIARDARNGAWDVIDGNHRLEVMRAAGRREIPAMDATGAFKGRYVSSDAMPPKAAPRRTGPDARPAQGGRRSPYQEELRAQGFDVESPLYRGMTRQAEGGDFTRNADLQGSEQFHGTSFSRSTSEANLYAMEGDGGAVYPAYMRGRLESGPDYMRAVQARARESGVTNQEAARQVQQEYAQRGVTGVEWPPDRYGKGGEVRIFDQSNTASPFGANAPRTAPDGGPVQAGRGAERITMYGPDETGAYTVEATVDGKLVGRTDLFPHEGGFAPEGGQVIPAFQRQGVMSRILQHAEQEIGASLRRPMGMTDEGRAMWEQYASRRTAPNAGSDRNALQRALRDRMNRE